MSTDEEWLQLVGELAREDARHDEEILAQLARTDEGRELLAPLGGEVRARVAAAAFPDRRGKRAKAVVIALQGGGALAVAAALLLWVSASRRSAPLPGYEVSVTGPASTTRGAPALVGAATNETIALRPEGPFELVLRPNETVKGSIAAAAFFIAGPEARPWAAPIEVSAEGAVRIAGTTDVVFAGQRGELDLLVIVARPNEVPDAAHAESVAATPSDAQKIARLHVRISP